MRHLITSIRLFAALTVLTGILYPLAVTGIGRALFSSESAGNPVSQGGVVRGSALVGQKFTADKFFRSRPSAGDYGTMPSAASNLSPLAKKQIEAVEARMKSDPGAASEMYYTSGSGLDPDITPQSAAAQAERVARARCVSLEEIKQAIAGQTRQAALEPPLVNVLKLNLLLEEKGYACKPGI
jgi:K+-transporting ATPase ATPase C chain